MENTDKIYAITYPSLWGMGSGTDMELITLQNLRELILMETERYASGDNWADGRFSGTCNEEVFCDSNDPEERIADVLNKLLATSSTYADHNDLIEIPSDVQVKVSEMKMKNTIVRLCNQFLCGRDIIFGEGDFRLFALDTDQDFFKENYVFKGYYGEHWLRFIDYELKNVAEYHMGELSKLDFVLNSHRDKLKRLTEKQNGIKIKHKGAFIDDLIPEIADDDYLAEGIAEAKQTILKFEDMPVLKDEYDSHLYDLKNHTNEYLRKTLKKISDDDKKIDHTRIVYEYPIATKEFGAKYDTEKNDPSHHLSYQELFKKGYDLKCLVACFSDSADTFEELGTPDLVSVFSYLFAYD